MKLCDHCRPWAATSKAQLENRQCNRERYPSVAVHECEHCGSTDWATALIEHERSP